ncbi:MAG TPA: YafY family transcriptional regulator [Clostridiales bacterium]|nr:YafY family transcriptional regulator [Clostridiales bacterium]
MQINRLFEIIYILLNKKSVTAQELAEHFEVSRRTIYRDIDILCESGIPIYTNKGKGGGICLLENYVLNKSVLTDQEQADILAALQGLNATIPSDRGQILSKLDSLFGNKNTDWIEVDFSNWSSREEDKLKFQQIKDSILNHKVIQFHYYSSYGKETFRVLEPAKLIFKGQAWYLLGFCREKQDIRYFKISRIQKLFVTEEGFEPRPLDAATENHSEASLPSSLPPTQELLLKVNPSMAYRIYDEFPASAITRDSDGNFLIHTHMPAGVWLYGYLMSYEDQLELLEPVDIRNELIAKYKNALGKYKL